MATFENKIREFERFLMVWRAETHSLFEDIKVDLRDETHSLVEELKVDLWRRISFHGSLSMVGDSFHSSEDTIPVPIDLQENVLIPCKLDTSAINFGNLPSTPVWEFLEHSPAGSRQEVLDEPRKVDFGHTKSELQDCREEIDIAVQELVGEALTDKRLGTSISELEFEFLHEKNIPSPTPLKFCHVSVGFDQILGTSMAATAKKRIQWDPGGWLL